MLAIFLDIETNGLNPYKHKVIEIAYQIVDVSNGQVIDRYHSVVSQPEEIWKLSDKESLKVNGFTFEEVGQGQPANKVATSITNSFQKCGIRRGQAVFICQNPSFDRVFFSQLIDPEIQESLRWPYHWLDLASMYWVEALRTGRTKPEKLPWATGFSKDRIAAAYGLPPEAGPHRAMNGVDHLVLCYQAVVGFKACKP